MQYDNNCAKNDLINNTPFKEKLSRMLAVLENDKEYHQEYERFVKSVSYAKEGAAPDFANAMQSIRHFIHAITI